MNRTRRWIRTLAVAAPLALSAAAGADTSVGKTARAAPAAHPTGDAPEQRVGTGMTDGGAARATGGGSMSPPVGRGSSDMVFNGSNANIGNSTGQAAMERMPHLGAPRR